jgi:hypothetical protein
LVTAAFERRILITVPTNWHVNENFDEVTRPLVGGSLAAPQTLGNGFAVFANNTLTTEKTIVVPVLVTIQIPSSGDPAIAGIEEIYHLV